MGWTSFHTILLVGGRGVFGHSSLAILSNQSFYIWFTRSIHSLLLVLADFPTLVVLLFLPFFPHHIRHILLSVWVFTYLLFLGADGIDDTSVGWTFISFFKFLAWHFLFYTSIIDFISSRFFLYSKGLFFFIEICTINTFAVCWNMHSYFFLLLSYKMLCF